MASPISIGPLDSASRSISSPPARLIAPATPAPIQSALFAAFAIASTSSAVMSPSTTSSSSIEQRVEAEREARRQCREPLEREQHARDIGLAGERVVAD